MKPDDLQGVNVFVVVVHIIFLSNLSCIIVINSDHFLCCVGLSVSLSVNFLHFLLNHWVLFQPNMARNIPRWKKLRFLKWRAAPSSKARSIKSDYKICWCHLKSFSQNSIGHNLNLVWEVMYIKINKML